MSFLLVQAPVESALPVLFEFMRRPDLIGGIVGAVVASRLRVAALLASCHDDSSAPPEHPRGPTLLTNSLYQLLYVRAISLLNKKYIGKT